MKMMIELTVFHLLLIRTEESQRLHELVALRDGYIGVIQLAGVLAVDVEPPVTLQDGLVEESGFGAEERLHNEAVVG